MPFIIETCTAQHIGDRDEQQDRVALFQHPVQRGAVLAVVADGMGGHSGGALAAEQAELSARTVFQASPLDPDNLPAVLKEIVDAAHAGIRTARHTSAQDPHSTLCLLLVQGPVAVWAHCGDTRLYHFRRGVLAARTRDHSHVMDLVERGYLTEVQAAGHPQKNLLVSCLGDDKAPRIDFGGAVALTAGDCFLLCSDGVWAHFGDDELGHILAAHPPRKAAELLIEGARERARGRGDNCSLAIVRVKPAEPDQPYAV